MDYRDEVAPQAKAGPFWERQTMTFRQLWEKFDGHMLAGTDLRPDRAVRGCGLRLHPRHPERGGAQCWRLFGRSHCRTKCRGPYGPTRAGVDLLEREVRLELLPVMWTESAFWRA
jgi:hypothetical protein